MKNSARPLPTPPKAQNSDKKVYWDNTFALFAFFIILEGGGQSGVENLVSGGTGVGVVVGGRDEAPTAPSPTYFHESGL